MNTTVYLIRHSEPSKIINYLGSNDSLQIRNEKNILSSFGEEKAKELSLTEEMQNIDVVISSKYVRAISTAKYIAENNNTNINVIEDFEERKFGINSWDELPKDFEKKQLEDKTYKLNDGENQIEVAKRMYNALLEVIKEHKGKRIVIVSHATAITFLFINYFSDKITLDNNFKWNAPEVFKLEFNNNSLESIKNIRVN